MIALSKRTAALASHPFAHTSRQSVVPVAVRHSFESVAFDLGSGGRGVGGGKARQIGREGWAGKVWPGQHHFRRPCAGEMYSRTARHIYPRTPAT